MLVIGGDDWAARQLANGLRDHSFVVMTCCSDRDVVRVAGSFAPDCVVAEVQPGLAGSSIVRLLRQQDDPLGRVPVICLASRDDSAARAAAFLAGCDICLSRECRVGDLALQIEAVIAMAARLQGPAKTRATHRQSDDVALGPAMEGDLTHVSVATALTLLELEQCSGVVSVSSGGKDCSLELAGGRATGGAVAGRASSALVVVREMLRSKQGRFCFQAGPGASSSTSQAIGALLLEAARLEDEASAGAPSWSSDEAPTIRRATLSPGSGTRPATRPRSQPLADPSNSKHPWGVAPRPSGPRRAVGMSPKKQ